MFGGFVSLLFIITLDKVRFDNNIPKILTEGSVSERIDLRTNIIENSQDGITWVPVTSSNCGLNASILILVGNIDNHEGDYDDCFS